MKLVFLRNNSRRKLYFDFLGFAYDWLDNNILWSESDILQKGSIRIFSMDKYAHTDLYANLDNPTYVNVNPLDRFDCICD